MISMSMAPYPTMTLLKQGGRHVLRAPAVRGAPGQAGRVGEVHGGGDHPLPGQDGHGHPRQLRGRGGPERVRVDPPLRERGRAQAALRRGLPERLLEERHLPPRRPDDRPRADQGDPPDRDAALADPVTDSPLETARKLAPMIRASAPETDALRELPRPIFEAMADAGLFRLALPRTLGGFEMDLPSYIQVIQVLGR